MRKYKFKIGDKVVPIQKSVWGPLEKSGHWESAQQIEQPFLYVTGIYEKDFIFGKNAEGNYLRIDYHYICNDENLNSGGDFFMEEDLKLYEEKQVLDEDLDLDVIGFKLSTIDGEVLMEGRTLRYGCDDIENLESMVHMYKCDSFKNGDILKVRLVTGKEYICIVAYDSEIASILCLKNGFSIAETRKYHVKFDEILTINDFYVGLAGEAIFKSILQVKNLGTFEEYSKEILKGEIGK